MTFRSCVSVVALLLVAPLTSAATSEKSVYVDLEKQNVAAFIDEMVDKHDFDAAALRSVFGKTRIKASIIKKISTPAERRLTWNEYRKIFMTRERIDAGADFWHEHKEMLERIELETGVPVAMLVGIIGVETYFGRITGKDRVIDALSTLAFEYPPRARFFRNELVQFLILAREEEVDPMVPTGSYAGAMGRPQFMPSSFRAYAVDSSGDGKRDIWNSWADAVGSIANYFVAHGWKTGEEVVTSATLGCRWKGDEPEPENRLKITATVASLGKLGVKFTTELPTTSGSQLLSYEGSKGIEHWVGFHNFFVITKYNRSAMYALAVYQLGKEIATEVHDDAS